MPSTKLTKPLSSSHTTADMFGGQVNEHPQQFLCCFTHNVASGGAGIRLQSLSI